MADLESIRSTPGSQPPSPQSRLGELVELSDRATPGEWQLCDIFAYPAEGVRSGKFNIAEMGHDGEPRHGRERDDAALIVAAVNFVRSGLPQLLERISSLEGALEERDRKIERFKSRDVQWRSLVASLVAEAQRNHGGDLIDLLHNAAIQAQEALSQESGR